MRERGKERGSRDGRFVIVRDLAGVVGLDVHETTTAVAVAREDARARYGSWGFTPIALMYCEVGARPCKATRLCWS
jgi:hypothetical protein